MITEEVWEEAWEVIARVRDAYPSADDDGPPTDEIVEALADAGLLARTEAWEDNALAEAWDEGYQDGLRQGGEGEDGPRYVNPYRAAGRAESAYIDQSTDTAKEN